MARPRKFRAVAEGPPQETEDRRSIGTYTHDTIRDPQRAKELLELGQRLAAARQERGLTQKQFSELVGKSRATIVQYEQGRLQPPLDQIRTMAAALDVAPERIAFGLQGISGLAQDTAAVSSFPELKLEGANEEVSGAHGFASALVEHLGLEPEQAKVYVLNEAAPAFGLSPGDRIIVSTDISLTHESRLYALRTPRGVAVVRLLPRLSPSPLVNLNGGYGETTAHDPRDLDVLGLIVGSIQAR